MGVIIRLNLLVQNNWRTTCSINCPSFYTTIKHGLTSNDRLKACLQKVWKLISKVWNIILDTATFMYNIRAKEANMPGATKKYIFYLLSWNFQKSLETITWRSYIFFVKEKRYRHNWFYCFYFKFSFFKTLKCFVLKIQSKAIVSPT